MKSVITLQLSAQLFSLCVGIFSYRRKSVSKSGFIALIGISSLFIWTNEIALLFVMFFMFASSSALTHFKKSNKVEFEKIVAKSGPRDYIQALSNLGVATALLIIYLALPSEIFIISICASIAAANADSWASEIGGLSKKTPIMITNFKPVTKGVSGGITGLGTAGGVLGSLFITILSILFLNWLTPFQADTIKSFFSIFIAGVLGFVFDSYIGALLQALYQNKSNTQLSEGNRGNMHLVKGYHWINNDVVNFLSTVFGAIVGALIYYLMR